MKISVPKADFSYITDDSRECSQEGAFLLTKMSEAYIEDATSRGCEHFIKPENLLSYLDSDLPVVGVTGTNGKTTTAAAVYSILLDLGYGCAFQGTPGFYLNETKQEGKTLTTPLVLQNHYHIHEAKQISCDCFVMEASSHAIKQERIAGLQFGLKILTNITSDHLDFHGSLEDYIQTKNSFFQDEIPKLINRDEKRARFNPMNGYGYAIESPATYKIEAYSLNDGIHAVLNYMGKERIAFSSPLFGLHNLYNLTAAFAAVHILTRRPFNEIADQVENFGGVAGRMEVVSDDPLVIIDFAHTHDGMAKVMESFPGKKILVVFGAGGDRDRQKRPLMGEVAERYGTHLMVTSDNPRSENPQTIIGDILMGIKDRSHVSVEADRELAIQKALEMAEGFDVVLILGKGDEEYQEVDGKKYPFSDKEIIKNILNSKTIS